MFEPDSHEHDLLNRASLDHCVKCTICETQCPVAEIGRASCRERV